MAMEFDIENFGPVDLSQEDGQNVDEVSTEEKKVFQVEVAVAKSLIKKGYNRIKEKIRAIRKAYNKAVTNDRRFGSGKVVQEYYEQLAEIWKGSPATEQLKFGVISSNNSEGSSVPSTPSTIEDDTELEQDNSPELTCNGDESIVSITNPDGEHEAGKLVESLIFIYIYIYIYNIFKSYGIMYILWYVSYMIYD